MNKKNDSAPINVVAGTTIDNEAQKHVIECLEETLEAVKNGNLKGANKVFVLTADASNGNVFTNHIYIGEHFEMLGLLDNSKMLILQGMYEE